MLRRKREPGPVLAFLVMVGVMLVSRREWDW
jgi:hypothetical protein